MRKLKKDGFWVYVGGQLVSGGLSTHYDILHQCLVKSSASEDWCRSRYNEHAKELIENGDDINSFHQNVAGGGGQLEGAASNLVGTDLEYPEFDPWGFSKTASEDQMFWYRAAELKHARVAMLASLGQIFAYF
jgi:hypothetical protein